MDVFSHTVSEKIYEKSAGKIEKKCNDDPKIKRGID